MVLVLAGIVLVATAAGRCRRARTSHAVPGRCPYRRFAGARRRGNEPPRRALRTHIRAIASRPHNIEHYDGARKSRALHRSRVEGARLSARAADLRGGWPRGPQHRSCHRAGQCRRKPRHHRARRALRFLRRCSRRERQRHRDRPLCSNWRACCPIFATEAQARIRFVLFVNEEPPYFQTRRHGQLSLRPAAGGARRAASSA